jgi:hypothetical protein
MLVAIIGGKYGSESKQKNMSVSQMELRRALELKIQVYIFIDKNVYAEYQTYILNKKNKSIKYRFANDIKIFEFIEFCNNLPNNNNIYAFETSLDIIQYLREQWAGLFQRLLQEQPRNNEINLLKGIETTANTLNQLVNFLTEERKDRDGAIKDILLSNHPAMEEVRKLLKVTYRVYFSTKDELIDWLTARSYTQPPFDDDAGVDCMNFYYNDNRQKKSFVLSIKRTIFNEDGKLKVYRNSEWQKEFIQLTETSTILTPKDEDLPF